MKPYFYDLQSSLFSDDLLYKVDTLAKDRLAEFRGYKSIYTNELDGNNFYRNDELNNIDEIKAILERCSVQCFPLIMLHKPHTKVIRHRDDPNRRNCVIITPISPINNYTPTYFWENKDDTKPIAICNFEKGLSVLVNTQRLHSLVNDTDQYRINLQLCFDADFETILQLYQTDSLFKE
jgi:hypothetical protein